MDRRIELVITRIESDSVSNQDLKQLGALVNLSSSRLRHLFKQETGTTPTHYLKTLRVRKAELLLRTTFLSIKEVASKVGINSSSHFVREFKKMYGTTPTKYRVLVNRKRRKS